MNLPKDPVMLLSVVNTIASIMTFTNNAQTMADLSSAIYGTAALLIAVVLNIIAAFTNVNEQ